MIRNPISIADAITGGARRNLAAKLSADATSFSVETGGADFPDSAFEVAIGNEIISVGTRTDNDFSDLTRADAGTTAAAHGAGADVIEIISATTIATDLAGGGVGGSQPGAARVLGPFPFTHATPNLNAGVDFYTPTIGDILLDFWVETDTLWNGTTPLCDIGSAEMFTNGQGMISALGNAPCDLGNEDFEDFYNMLNGMGAPQGGVNAMLAAASGGFTPNRRLPAKFTKTDPLQVVVSQDGMTDGDPTGSTAGASGIYLVVATPDAP